MIIYNIYTSNFIQAYSVKNRLLKFLQWLNNNYPQEGWNTFYTSSGALNWHLMLWAGHSQGGGLTQTVSVDYPIARAIQISQGFIETVPQATTPPSRIYTFYHQFDQTVRHMPQVNTALQLNQFGPLVLVNDVTSFSQFGTSHMLVTNISVPLDQAHNVPAVDIYLPFSSSDSTMPLWDPFVWAYLIGEPSALTPASASTDTQSQTTTKPVTTRPPSPSSSTSVTSTTTKPAVSSSTSFLSISRHMLVLCSLLLSFFCFM